MKIFSHAAVAVMLLTAAQAMAQINQPMLIPAAGDYGVFSSRDQSYGPQVYGTTTGSFDPYLAKAYDNFTLANDFIIDGFGWAGIYDEAFPVDASTSYPTPADTDFVVEIWNTNPAYNDHADVWAGPVLSFNFEGGATAGAGGADMTVTQLAHNSPATVTVPGGGNAYKYDANVTPTTLAAGDYWISILADQEFTTVGQNDPIWMWHLGTGPGDGFTSFDRLDPAPTSPLQSGNFIAGKDLAYSIEGKLVPEPSSALMAAFGLVAIGMLRRKRS